MKLYFFFATILLLSLKTVIPFSSVSFSRQLRRKTSPGLTTNKYTRQHVVADSLSQLMMSIEEDTSSIVHGERRIRDLADDFEVWKMPHTNHLYSLSLRKGIQDVAVANIIQDTNGKVPRGYLPALLSISIAADLEDVSRLRNLIDEAIRWYLDCGGRAAQLQLMIATDFLPLHEVIEDVGFIKISSPENQEIFINEMKPNSVYFTVDVMKLLESYKKRMNNTSDGSEVETISDVIGRLTHSNGDPREAIEFYTKALTINPKNAATFRNLGSAYHAIGDMQLAFASYQQALELDPQDSMVYLKLAFFYEDFASKDWPDAEINAKRCYEYYLQHVDSEDIAILTRVANLCVRENLSNDAILIYDRIIKLNETSITAWFNKAYAQIKIKDFNNAKISLKKVQELDQSLSAVSHMLQALNETTAKLACVTDEQYVKDLFNEYSITYDKHVKKLIYAAPRVIRQELSTIYKNRYKKIDEVGNIIIDEIKIQQLKQNKSLVINNDKITTITAAAADGCESTTDINFIAAVDEEPVTSTCTTYTSFMNHTMDILDIGCGTGQVGGWLKDYAASLTGVDISKGMIEIARKKGLYQELYEVSISEYFQSINKASIIQSTNEIQRNKTFDIITAADVFAYVGDLEETFQNIATVLRPKGLFAFTVEAVNENDVNKEKGYRLLTSGRFGYLKSYISEMILKMGENYQIIMSRDFSPRLEEGEAVPGYLYIIERLK